MSEMTKEQIEKVNRFNFLAATVWHLNNVDEEGNPTTTMCIPNGVYEILSAKLKQIPEGVLLEEKEMLELVRKK